MKFEFFNLIAN